MPLIPIHLLFTLQGCIACIGQGPLSGSTTPDGRFLRPPHFIIQISRGAIQWAQVAFFMCAPEGRMSTTVHTLRIRHLTYTLETFYVASWSTDVCTTLSTQVADSIFITHERAGRLTRGSLAPLRQGSLMAVPHSIALSAPQNLRSQTIKNTAKT